MSELNAFDVGLGQYCEDGSPCVVAFDADRNPRLLNEKVYLKSEADKVIAEKDKVIAELKEKHKTEVKELLCLIRDKDNNFNRAFDSEQKEIRRQKYKRCLAMARWCRTSARCDEGLGAFKYRDWYWKWFKRWLELADKFKEGK